MADRTPICERTHTLMIRQTVTNGVWPQDALEVNSDDPDNDNYAVLNQLEQFRSNDGKFYFKLNWPNSVEDVTMEWSQTSNPLVEDVVGYEPIDVPYTGRGWGGLEPSSNGLMDGSVLGTYKGNWFWAVGAYGTIGNNLLPAYAKSDNDYNYGQDQVELYVHKKQDICYAVSTSNWDCPNGHSIDGTYRPAGEVNGKTAWQKSDGTYLRWASMWIQWIFDDDTVDSTSVAWMPASASSTKPSTGTFSDYRYGMTCGNNGVYVSSLTITEFICGSDATCYVENDNSFLSGYPSSATKCNPGYCSLGEAKAYCDTLADCGGVTLDRDGLYTVRAGTVLNTSPAGEVSWKKGDCESADRRQLETKEFSTLENRLINLQN